MSKRSKRKAYGKERKQSCDLHHHKKKKSSSAKPALEGSGIKHLRVGRLKG